MSEEVTEPTAEPTPEPKAELNEVHQMVAKLNELEIESVDQLDKMATASQSSGRIANLYGEEKKANARLEARIAELEAKQPATNEYEEGGIDIDAMIGKATASAVTKALDERDNAKRKAREAKIREAQEIRSDKNYAVVAEKFERFMTSPKAQSLLARGITPTKIYNKMVTDEYRNMAMTMKTAFEGADGTPDKTLVPHMESGQEGQPQVEPADVKKNKIKKIREKWTGSDADVEKALNAILPSGSLPMPNR